MRRRIAVITTALVLAASSAANAGPGAPADPGSPGSRAASAGSEHRAAQARAALAEVEAIFSGTPAGSARTGEHADHSDHSGREATMALRDLAMLRGSLTGKDKAAADAVLARPTDTSVEFPEAPKYGDATPLGACGTNVCVHYVTTGPHAVDITDADVNGFPDYVDFALSTLETVHTTYVGAGYRAPKSDLQSSNNGGDAKTDIYLGDIGDNGLYGYCTTDDPNAAELGGAYPHWDVSAFCVLDEDYAEFVRTPTQNLRVTAAHEYFHAVQFGYDVTEDSWLMEGTATWVEDELFDGINDNRQFLATSPLRQPGASLDEGTNPRHYGAWAYWRYLSESNRKAQGGLPTIIRDVWRRADGSPTAAFNDQYSIQAVKNTLAARGKKFGPDFSRFAAFNRHPARSYEEGSAWPTAPLAGTFVLKPTRRSTGWRVTRINHLATRTVRLTPSRLPASNWRLRLNLDLPYTSRGSRATVQVYKKNGSIAVSHVTLSRSGDATKTYPFSTGSVKYVEVTLTNASTRYSCWRNPGTVYSCQGTPLDNSLAFKFRATAYRS